MPDSSPALKVPGDILGGVHLPARPLLQSQSLRPGVSPPVSQVVFKDLQVQILARGGMGWITHHSSNTVTQAKVLRPGKVGSFCSTSKQMAPICLSVFLSLRFPNLRVPKLQGGRSVLR